MSHRFDFSTQADWDKQVALTGDAGVGTNDPATGQPFTAQELTRALYRANAYIRIAFYDLFSDEYKGVSLEVLLDNVREDLIEATNYAASHELLTPGIYSKTVTHTNTQTAGQQLKAKTVGPIKNEYYEDKSGDTVTRVQNEQTIDFNIHTLLDKYRPLEVAGDDRVPFVFGVVASGA